MKKRLLILLFLAALFAPFMLAAGDFAPGVAAGAILQNPHVQRIMDIGKWFIVVIFAGVLTKNLFTFVTGAGKPNWFTIIGKFLIIFFLYNNAVWVVTEFVNKVIVETNVSDTEMISESFSKLDVALMSLALGDPEQLEKSKAEARQNSVLPDAVTDTFFELKRAFTPQTILVVVFSIMMKGILVIAMITKLLMIDIFWPIFFQLTIIGFVFAVPFASLDGGMDAIKKFAINVVEIAMWPVLYNIAFVLCSNELVRTINKFVALAYELDHSESAILAATANSAKILADLPLIATLAAQLLFVVFLGLLIPMFARMIVRNESVGIAASAVTYSVGQGLMKGAAAIGGMAGMAMMNAGKGIAGMTAKGAAESAGAAGGTTAGETIGGSGGHSSGTTTTPPQESGSTGNSGATSKVTGDLGSEGSGGRAAHGGKAFYNQHDLTREENQALNNLRDNPAAKAEFAKLQGMRKDGYNPKAIENQINNINKQFGTNLNSGKKEGDNK